MAGIDLAAAVVKPRADATLYPGVIGRFTFDFGGFIEAAASVA